jgi:hypothetical protein
MHVGLALLRRLPRTSVALPVCSLPIPSSSLSCVPISHRYIGSEAVFDAGGNQLPDHLNYFYNNTVVLAVGQSRETFSAGARSCLVLRAPWHPIGLTFTALACCEMCLVHNRLPPPPLPRPG